MASQCDIFDEFVSDVDEKKACVSLPTYFYKWVILFQWDIKENKSRFKVFDRDLFPEIKNEWVKGQLKDVSRGKKLKKLAAENGEFSLFGKIENGMYFFFKKKIFL